MARKRVDPKTTPNAIMQNAKPEKRLCPETQQNNKKMQNAEAKEVQPLLCETMNPGKPGEEGPEAHD